MIPITTPFLQNVNLIEVLRNQKVSRTLERDFVYAQKHQLKCESCFWTTSYVDASGFLNISGTEIQCPVCKKGLVKVNDNTYHQNERYVFPSYLSFVLTDW